MKRTFLITENQYKGLNDLFGENLLEDITDSFSIDFIKTNKWRNTSELLNYCDKYGLYKIGEGANRIVYQISDEYVLKIEKDSVIGSGNQNEQEVATFKKLNDEMKQLVPNIIDYDKNNPKPLWIIAEQVLPAKYADFQKILGFDFGSYESIDDITNMKKDLQVYSKYDGKTVNSFSFNLMDFLESYGNDDDFELYHNQIKNNQWLKDLYMLLSHDFVSYWELENINNWGLVKRNGEPKLIVLDIGI